VNAAAGPGPRIAMQFAPAPGVRGVTVARLESEGHLYRVVAQRQASMLHLEGRSHWTMRGARHQSGPGTIDVKFPGELYLEQARFGRARLQVVLFDDALVEEARATLGRAPAPPAHNAFASGDPRVRAIRALHAALLDGPAREDQVCLALASLVELTSAPEGQGGRLQGRAAVRRARALLDGQLAETISLDALAAHARLDKFRLCRAFRDEVGLPPHAYVTHRRVSAAMELLARGEPQAEVAARVGLYDQSQLHRHFKRIVGVTPGAYARAVR
jgi:AraC-like DNA-binding protein